MILIITAQKYGVDVKCYENSVEGEIYIDMHSHIYWSKHTILILTIHVHGY